MNQSNIHANSKKRKKTLKKLTLKKTPFQFKSSQKSSKHTILKNINEKQKKNGEDSINIPSISYKDIINSQEKPSSKSGFFQSTQRDPLKSSSKKRPNLTLRPIPELGQGTDLVDEALDKMQREIQQSIKYNPYSLKKTPNPILSLQKSSVKGMSSKLAPMTVREGDEGITQRDIRKLIEAKYDTGREIENLSRPIDEDQASRICWNESLKAKLQTPKPFDLYIRNNIWKQFGEGVFFYFSFMGFFSLVLLVVGLLGIPVVVMNLKGGDESPETDQNQTRKLEYPQFFSQMTYGNLRDIGEYDYEKLKGVVVRLEDKLEEQGNLSQNPPEEIIIMKHPKDPFEGLEDKNNKIKKEIQQKLKMQDEGVYSFLRKRFKTYLWIEFSISLIFFIALIFFQFWIRSAHKNNKKLLTIKDFSLEITGLQPILTEKENPSKFLYKNNDFWKGKLRQEPHSVNTFYVKKKTENYFFGKEFKNKELYNPLSSRKTLTSIGQSKTTFDKNGSMCRISIDSSQFKFPSSIKEKGEKGGKARESVPNSVDRDKIKQNNKFFEKPIITQTKIKEMDQDFEKLKQIGRKTLSVESLTKYFLDHWDIKVKSIKFVFDFKDSLGEMVQIAENSYKLNKLSSIFK